MPPVDFDKLFRNNPDTSPIIVNVSDIGFSDIKDKIHQEFQNMINDPYSLTLLQEQDSYVILDLNQNRELLECFEKYNIILGFNNSGRQYATENGAKVKSKAEAMIANAFTSFGIDYIYEPLMIFKYHRNNFFQVPDFFLPSKGIVHEHFGKTNDKEYKIKADKKIQLYNKYNVRWFFTTPKDEEDIFNSMLIKLAEANFFM